MATRKSLGFSRILASTINLRLLDMRIVYRISVWLIVTNILVSIESFCDLQGIIQVWVAWCYIFTSCGNPCNISYDRFFDADLWFFTAWISILDIKKPSDFWNHGNHSSQLISIIWLNYPSFWRFNGTLGPRKHKFYFSFSSTQP